MVLSALNSTAGAKLDLHRERYVNCVSGLPTHVKLSILARVTNQTTIRQLQRAQPWQSLCSAHTISMEVLNLPPSISPYQGSKPQTLATDGVIQPRAYRSRLIEITTGIQYRDNANTTQGSNAKLYASALELDKGTRSVEHIKPDHVAQFLHCCINMRIHLSFAMGKYPDE